jgi:hypothetical protein
MRWGLWFTSVFFFLFSSNEVGVSIRQFGGSEMEMGGHGTDTDACVDVDLDLDLDVVSGRAVWRWAAL